MPKNKFYTTDINLKGSNVEIVSPDNNDDILKQCINGYIYRINELKNGVIELGELGLLDDLNYHKDSGDMDLYPLQEDYNNNDLKSGNIYSNCASLKK